MGAVRHRRGCKTEWLADYRVAGRRIRRCYRTREEAERAVARADVLAGRSDGLSSALLPAINAAIAALLAGADAIPGVDLSAIHLPTVVTPAVTLIYGWPIDSITSRIGMLIGSRFMLTRSASPPPPEIEIQKRAGPGTEARPSRSTPPPTW